MTRSRKRKHSEDRTGFTVMHPGGNWIRIFPLPTDAKHANQSERGSC